MKRLVLLGLLAVAAWQGYKQYQTRQQVRAADYEGSEVAAPTPQEQKSTAPRFRCDGRTYCSQMTSCAEASYFLRNCPDTKMDGDGDGIPCEQQWCNG